MFNLKQEEEKPRTRCGYEPHESVRAFEKSLGQSDLVSAGRALHFAADIATSGGIDILMKSIWDYTLCILEEASGRNPGNAQTSPG